MSMESTYRTKKAMKDALKAGEFDITKLVETSLFGPEFQSDGRFVVEGPASPAPHTYYAEVFTKGGEVVKIA